MNITKRSLLRGSVGVCAAGVLTAACGSEDNDDTAGGGACTTQIATNHGHTLSISAADKMAGVAKDYDIKGSSDHSHTVSLAADDFADLSGGIVIVQSSTDGGHSHDVTITC